MSKETKNNAFFHEEAHIYFPTQETLDAFTKSFNKNSDWAIKQKARWKAVPSITQILSKVFPFNGSDLRITKAWYKKEALFLANRIEDEEEKKRAVDRIDKVIAVIESVEGTLDNSMKRAQDEGTKGHEYIQDYIETLGINPLNTSNVYSKAFEEALETNEELKKMVGSIKTILPSEIPIIATYKDKFTYAGKWDMLIQLEDGRTALIDIKTGSPLKYDKLKKVKLQLNAYKYLVEESIDIKVDSMMCWELSYNIDKETNEREYYFKWHEVEESNKFFELAENQMIRDDILKGVK